MRLPPSALGCGAQPNDYGEWTDGTEYGGDRGGFNGGSDRGGSTGGGTAFTGGGGPGGGGGIPGGGIAAGPGAGSGSIPDFAGPDLDAQPFDGTGTWQGGRRGGSRSLSEETVEPTFNEDGRRDGYQVCDSGGTCRPLIFFVPHPGDLLRSAPPLFTWLLTGGTVEPAKSGVGQAMVEAAEAARAGAAACEQHSPWRQRTSLCHELGG